MSGILLYNLHSEQSYWAKMGNQQYLRYERDGRSDGWNTCVNFIHSKRSKERTTYFCIRYPSGARDRMKVVFDNEKRRTVPHRDLFLDTLVAANSLMQWQADIGERRIRLLEVVRLLMQ